jgi:hypothetical protein
MDQKGLLWNKPEEGESSGDFSKVPYSGKKPKMQELLIYLTQLGLLQMGKTLYANQPIGADMLNEVLNSIPIALAWVHAPKQRFIGMTHEYGVAALLGIVYVLNYVTYCLVLPLMSTIKIMQLGGQFDASGRYQYQFPDGSINTLGNDLLRTVMPNIETADVEKLFSSFPRITISQRILELAYWTIGPHELATNYNNNMILINHFLNSKVKESWRDYVGFIQRINAIWDMVFEQIKTLNRGTIPDEFGIIKSLTWGEIANMELKPEL